MCIRVNSCPFVVRSKSRSALQFVVIIGIANFFADFTYEGARGIVGPFLGSLGASAATIGSLLVALILYFHGGFRTGFGVLLIPALICLAILVAARLLHPRPHELEEGAGHTFATTKLIRAYWIYLAAGALIAAGFADFALIGFHFHKANTVPENLIPVFYAVAMASSALASIPLGRLFDRFGPNISLFAFLISAVAAPFVFLGSFAFALFVMIFWGIGMR